MGVSARNDFQVTFFVGTGIVLKIKTNLRLLLSLYLSTRESAFLPRNLKIHTYFDDDAEEDM